MQTARIVQAVILMSIVALAASCAASKEYTSKLFKPAVDPVTDSQAFAVRFLDLGDSDLNRENWVSTDIIMGRDTNKATLVALDKLTETVPARTAAMQKDTTSRSVTPSVGEAVVQTVPVINEPVVKTTAAPNGTRTRKVREENK